MHDIKKILGNTVREYRTAMGLSQEKLAEILNLDSRTILNLLITYLKIPSDRIFYPNADNSIPELQTLLAILNDCTQQEVIALLPLVRYILKLLRQSQ